MIPFLPQFLLNYMTPILLSSLVVCSVMYLFYSCASHHKNDFGTVPKEHKVFKFLKGEDIPPGDYHFPSLHQTDNYSDAIEKITNTTHFIMTVFPKGFCWSWEGIVLGVAYNVLVCTLCAYMASTQPESTKCEIIHYAGFTGMTCFSLGHLQMSVLYRRSWRTTFIFCIEGLIWAIIIGFVQAYTWPTIEGV